MQTHPSYLSGIDLPERARRLARKLSPCRVCPFRCGIDRFKEHTGRCGMGHRPKIASWSLHFGEEPPISGERGSGTIFFSGCPMACVYCQNYPISQLRHGKEMGIDELAACMLELQRRGAHNINFVTPTHFTPQIVEALSVARDKGLRIPLVYNSSGYDDVQTLKLLEGIIDVYLPDMKYGDDETAVKLSGVAGYGASGYGASGYGAINRAAVEEMYRQVGEPALDEGGIIRRGLIIRHLVLPGNVSHTEEVLRFIAGLSPSIGISLMSQYFPAHRASDIPGLNRKLTAEEYGEAVVILDRFGLCNGWIQSP
jgi:putative pyruvate formate lyase activating enzyme